MVYPKPRIPTQPILSHTSFNVVGRDSDHVSSVLDARYVKFVTSGRVAIALALQLMKIGNNHKVLLPAYHCPAMVEPVIWSGATPLFYKIHPDTSVDMEDIERLMDDSVKLLIVAHYFGFPQNLVEIRSFCNSKEILLLEDCAHAFFGEYLGKSLGTYGDYAIASTMKFFPIYEGGCLVSDRHNIEQFDLSSAGLRFEIKATFNTLEKSFEYNRMRLLQRLLIAPLYFKDLIWKKIKTKAISGKIKIGPGASDGGFGFEEKWLDKRSTFFSRLLIKHVSKKRIVTKRRKHFTCLLNALSGLPGCRPLFTDLPDGTVPHVFPLIVDEPDRVFPILKNAGVPVVRFGEYLWNGIDSSVCLNSVNLSTNLLQFPCHQELLPDEQEWMIAQIKKIFLSA